MHKMSPAPSHVESLRPSNSKQKLIIVCHGYKSSSEHPALVAIVDGLHADGYAILSLNFSKSATIDIRKQVEEIRAAVERHPEYSEAILLAGSFGALSSSISARVVPGVSGLVTINGFFGSGKLDKKHANVYRAVKLLAVVSPKHRAILRYFKRELKPADIAVPVLVIHSRADEIVAYEGSEHFYAMVTSPKVFKSLATADHHLSSSKHIRSIVGWTSAWLKSI